MRRLDPLTGAAGMIAGDGNIRLMESRSVSQRLGLRVPAACRKKAERRAASIAGG